MSDRGMVNVKVGKEDTTIQIDQEYLVSKCESCGCNPIAILSCIKDFGICAMVLHMLKENEYTVL